MPTDDEIIKCIERLRSESSTGGYNLNPNHEDLKMIITGYLENENKFGYPACPCRLASGNKEDDMDIICPCVYRDDDISEYGSCYCSLYVDDEIASGTKEPQAIPERRDIKKSIEEDTKQSEDIDLDRSHGTVTERLKLNVNIWRCSVCGYLCAKEQPPPKCPICGASRERFELFIKAEQ
jgi:ferredoxin-thioredoxin reductase catalytic subunit